MLIWKKADFIKNDIFHKGFEIGIFIKLFDGIFEILGAISLVFIKPSNLGNIVAFFTNKEIMEDSNDFIANYLIDISSLYSIDIQYFLITYLLIHGIVKIIIFVLFLKEKKGGFIVASVSLVLFILYQMYHFYLTHSIMMLAFTIMDIILLILVYIEYRKKQNI